MLLDISTTVVGRAVFDEEVVAVGRPRKFLKNYFNVALMK